MKLNMDWILGFIMYSLIVIFVLACICHTTKSKKPVNRVHFYVARDMDGMLYLYIGKPVKTTDEFIACNYGKIIISSKCFSEYGLNENDYDNLKWEDEPVEVFLNMEN